MASNVLRSWPCAAGTTNGMGDRLLRLPGEDRLIVGLARAGVNPELRADVDLAADPQGQAFVADFQ